MPKSSRIHDVAMFDLGTPQHRDTWVEYPDSLLFKVGEYKTHGFTMTPEEMKAAVERFRGPVPNELAHVNYLGVDTILDGKLGHVDAVRLSEDGTELRGNVKIPRWLDEVWDSPSKQVSCVWHRRNKTLDALGLVVNGAVKGAALMAAFSALEEITPEQRESLKNAATFTARKTTPEMTHHMQGIHDHVAVLQPGLCPASFGDRPKQAKALGKIHDYAVEHGASCPKMTAMSDSGDAREKAPMTAKEKLSRALFGDKSDAPALSITDEQAEAALAALEPKVPDAAALFAASPQGQAMQAKIAALEAENEKARQAAAQTDAVRFSEDVVRSGRIPPVLKQDFARLILRFAADDHAKPETVTFSDAKTSAEKTGTRVEALMEFVARLPKSLHDAPAFDPAVGLGDKFRALFNDDQPKRKDGDLTAQEEEDLLRHYSTGRKIINDRQKARA